MNLNLNAAAAPATLNNYFDNFSTLQATTNSTALFNNFANSTNESTTTPKTMNPMFSQLFYQQQIAPSISALPSTNSPNFSNQLDFTQLLSHQQKQQQLQQQQQQQQVAPNAFIYSQLELLQQLQISKQQEQQQQQQTYKLSLMEELLKIEQQQQQQKQPQSQSFGSILNSNNDNLYPIHQAQQQLQFHQDPSTNRLLNPNFLQSLQQNQQLSSTMASASPLSSTLFQSQMNIVQDFSHLLNTTSMNNTNINPVSSSQSLPLQAATVQPLHQLQQQQSSQLIPPNIIPQQLIGQLFMDSSNVPLSQATSNANSPFGNLRGICEEDVTNPLQYQAIPLIKCEDNKINKPITGTATGARVSVSSITSTCNNNLKQQQQQREAPLKFKQSSASQQQQQQPQQVSEEQTSKKYRFPRELFGEDAEERRLERLSKIERFRNKRRSWMRKVSYDCRKKVADSRLRVKGRFISKVDMKKIKELVGSSAQDAFNEKKNLRLDFMNEQMREQNVRLEQATSKNEILNQIEALLVQNKLLHAQQTMQSVLERIRNKQPLFSTIKRSEIHSYHHIHNTQDIPTEEESENSIQTEEEVELQRHHKNLSSEM